jgi:site-specific DNA-methyltransferase (adenine-specific)
MLKALGAVPVERNRGIDGFLRDFINGHPVSVRIQKEYEDIETAKRKLLSASKRKKCALMILVRTKRDGNYSFFDWADENLLVIDSYDLAINSWLESRGYSKVESLT